MAYSKTAAEMPYCEVPLAFLNSGKCRAAFRATLQDLIGTALRAEFDDIFDGLEGRPVSEERAI